MTTLEQAARQALEALDESWHLIPKPDYARLAIAALREALEPPKQEPTLYQYRTRANWEGALGWSAWENCTKAHAQDYLNCPLVHDWLYEVRALYTEPPKSNWQEIECPCCGDLARAFPPAPKREWVGLTDVEIGDALIDLPVLGEGYFLRIARAIEAKLQQLNQCNGSANGCSHKRA